MSIQQKIKPYDIILVKSKGFVPKAIRYFTRSEWNHAAIVMPIGNVLHIAESTAKGFIRTKCLHEYLTGAQQGDRVIEFKRYTGKKLNAEIDVAFSDMLDRKYEFRNLLWFQLKKALFGKYVGSVDSKRVICSEAVAEIFSLPHSYQMTPEELSKHPDFTKVLKIENPNF